MLNFKELQDLVTDKDWDAIASNIEALTYLHSEDDVGNLILEKDFFEELFFNNRRYKLMLKTYDFGFYRNYKSSANLSKLTKNVNFDISDWDKWFKFIKETDIKKYGTDKIYDMMDYSFKNDSYMKWLLKDNNFDEVQDFLKGSDEFFQTKKTILERKQIPTFMLMGLTQDEKEEFKEILYVNKINLRDDSSLMYVFDSPRELLEFCVESGRQDYLIDALSYQNGDAVNDALGKGLKETNNNADEEMSYQYLKGVVNVLNYYKTHPEVDIPDKYIDDLFKPNLIKHSTYIIPNLSKEQLISVSSKIDERSFILKNKKISLKEAAELGGYNEDKKEHIPKIVRVFFTEEDVLDCPFLFSPEHLLKDNWIYVSKETFDILKKVWGTSSSVEWNEDLTDFRKLADAAISDTDKFEYNEIEYLIQKCKPSNKTVWEFLEKNKFYSTSNKMLLDYLSLYWFMEKYGK